MAKCMFTGNWHHTVGFIIIREGQLQNQTAMTKEQDTCVVAGILITMRVGGILIAMHLRG